MSGAWKSDGAERRGRLVRAIASTVATTYAGVAPILVATGWLSVPEGVFALASALFLIFVARIDAIEEMSLGPLKAKMRQTIGEAEEIMQHLRGITKVISRIALAKTMMGNFWLGSPPLHDQFAMHDELLHRLMEIGLSEKEIDEDVDDIWKRGVRIIYVNIIEKMMKDGLTNSQEDSKRGIQISEEIHRLRGEDKTNVPSSHQLREAASAMKIDVTKLYGWLTDYESFEQTGKIPRQASLIDAWR